MNMKVYFEIPRIYKRLWIWDGIASLLTHGPSCPRLYWADHPLISTPHIIKESHNQMAWKCLQAAMGISDPNHPTLMVAPVAWLKRRRMKMRTLGLHIHWLRLWQLPFAKVLSRVVVSNQGGWPKGKWDTWKDLHLQHSIVFPGKSCTLFHRIILMKATRLIVGVHNPAFCKTEKGPLKPMVSPSFWPFQVWHRWIAKWLHLHWCP